jgi:hypothetical protein
MSSVGVPRWVRYSATSRARLHHGVLHGRGHGGSDEKPGGNVVEAGELVEAGVG